MGQACCQLPIHTDNWPQSKKDADNENRNENEKHYFFTGFLAIALTNNVMQKFKKKTSNIYN